MSEDNDWSEEYYDCDMCDGTGEIDWGDDSSHDWIQCPQCLGDGRVW